MPWSEHASDRTENFPKRRRETQSLLRSLFYANWLNYATNAFVRCAEEVNKDPYATSPS